MSNAPAAALARTPLHALHLQLGAKMVAFAGYEMPVSYPAGIIAEHRHCRDSAALFDVSHMGQLRLLGDDAAKALESLVPMDIVDLAVGKQRYAFFTNSSGGLLDDLMVTRRAHGDGSELFLIVNAGCKAADIKHLVTHIGHRCTVQPLPDRALLALQGPKAVQALTRLNSEVAALTFMTGGDFALAGADCFVTRSGYTGEDGFEISVPSDQAEALARALLDLPEVRPAGLGARDTLRLEAGLCLYGHDIDETTTPVEAGLTWAIQKVRRSGGARHGGYPGAAAIDSQLAAGASTRRVGLVGLERVPVREGALIVDAHGRKLGHVTSGTLAPTVNEPIAMAYLAANHALPHHEVYAEVRGKRQPMRVSPMPFAPHRYFRG
jgi:aminomethyltransferase